MQVSVIRFQGTREGGRRRINCYFTKPSFFMYHLGVWRSDGAVELVDVLTFYFYFIWVNNILYERYVILSLFICNG
jgi:hypothetical protein